jgi:hypothetical protein
VALLAVLASSCANSGGQTGEEHTSCWSKLTPLSITADSPLGFSAQDSLELAAGEHVGALHWLPAPYPYGPESGDSELRLRITSLGSAQFATQDDGRAGATLFCPPSVLTDVTVEVDSAGGALHESFRGVLAASQAESATLSATLIGGQLGGSFAFEPAALADRTLAHLTLNFSFGVDSFSGALGAGVERSQKGDESGSASLENVPLACVGHEVLGVRAGCTE